MKCRFLTKDGLCSGIYSGFACIKKQCANYQQALKCEHYEQTGDYCKKYARFGCVGVGSCDTLADYLEAFADEEA